MDPRFWTSLLFCAALSGPVIPYASAQSKPQSTTPIPAFLPLPPSILPQAEPSKPHRRIYDNDNLPRGRTGALAFTDLSEVNDCDRSAGPRAAVCATTPTGSSISTSFTISTSDSVRSAKTSAKNYPMWPIRTT